MAMTQPWADARNILAVRLDSLGDVLMTSPALAAVKHSVPGVRVTLLTSGAGAEAARLLGLVDETLTYAAPWVAHGGPAGSAQLDRVLIRRLAAGRFDAAIIFTVCTQSALPAALLCRLADIPLRLAHARENPYDLLTDWVPDADVCATGMRHEVQRQMDLVRQVGYETEDCRLRLHYAPQDARRMREIFAAAGGRVDVPYLVVHPGANAPSRRYPAQRYGQVADALGVHTGCQIVFTGSLAEASLVAQAVSLMRRPVVCLAGHLALGELAALIAGAEVLLCNNTGPAHMAAALGTPVVVLYALTNPQHTPWRVRTRVLSHDVPCRNCLKSTCPQGHHDCLQRIEAHTVVEAVLDLMDDTPAAVPIPHADALAPVSPDRLHR